MGLRDWREVAVGSVRGFFEDGALSLAAAIAFYGALSLAPVALLAMSVGGTLWGHAAVRVDLVREARSLVGPAGARVLRTVLENAHGPGRGIMAAVGVLVVVFAATSVFAQLQYALNRVWGVRVRAGRRVWPLVRARLMSVGLIAAIGALLIVSLVASSVISFMAGQVGTFGLPGRVTLWQFANAAVSFVSFVLLFAAIFRVLPDANIAWRDVAAGAVLTALLFAAGKELIGLYLGRSTLASAYGAAGSLVVLLAWIYYASILLLAGAEFTEAFARNRGRDLEPKPWAERIPDGGVETPGR